MSDHITVWPDASASALDGEVDGAISQSDPPFQVSLGSPAGVYPRVVGVGTAGVSSAQLPTNGSFSVYVVGTFDDGTVLHANPDVGGFILRVQDSGKVAAAVWPTAFNNTSIISASAVVSTSAAHVIGLGFDRVNSHFWFSVDDVLVPAVLVASGLPTATGFSEHATGTDQFLESTYKVRVGYRGAGDESGTYYNHVKMWDRSHTSAQRVQVGDYLRTKWGL